MLILNTLLGINQVCSTITMDVKGLKTTNTLFSITVNTYDEEVVYITSNVAIVGDLQKSMTGVSSSIIFNNLMITESGNAQINAKGSTSGDSDIEVIDIEEAEQNIYVKLSRSSFKKNKPFDLAIQVTDQYDSLWGGEITLYVNDTIRYFKAVVKNGVYNKKITYANVGNYSITVESSNGIKIENSIEVTENSMEIEFIGEKIITSKTLRDIHIKLDSDYPATIYLQLECLDECSGLKFKEVGVNNITDFTSVYVNETEYSLQVYILSSGTFKWVANSDDFRYTTSSSFEVTSFVGEISSYFSSHSVTAYFPVSLIIRVYGDDNELYKYPVYITIEDQSGASSISSEHLFVGNGSTDLQIYYKGSVEEAFYKLYSNQSSSDLFSSSPITVYSNNIFVSHSEDWIPKYTGDSFKFNISIMDYQEKKIENTYGIYDLEFSLVSNESSLSGSQKFVSTKEGKVKITDLYLDSVGTYQLKILCESCKTFVTEEFEIKSDHCESSIITLFVMGVFIFLLIFCTAVFYFADRGRDNDNQTREKYDGRILLFHPIISIFVFQPPHRRLINSLQLIVSELSVFTFIGLFYFYYDSPTESSDKGFTDYNEMQVYIGASGWAAAQVVGFPLFIYKVFKILNPGKRACYYVACFTVALIDIALVILMSFIYCKGYIMFWIANFLLFLIVDLVFIQTLFMFLTKCIRPQISYNDVVPDTNQENEPVNVSEEQNEEQNEEKNEDGFVFDPSNQVDYNNK